ncbi:hypothetical protein D3C83_43450 [compost metagenome]
MGFLQCTRGGKVLRPQARAFFAQAVRPRHVLRGDGFGPPLVVLFHARQAVDGMQAGLFKRFFRLLHRRFLFHGWAASATRGRTPCFSSTACSTS